MEAEYHLSDMKVDDDTCVEENNFNRMYHKCRYLAKSRETKQDFLTASVSETFIQRTNIPAPIRNVQTRVLLINYVLGN